MEATLLLREDVDYTTSITDRQGRPYDIFVPFSNGGDAKKFKYMAEKVAIWESYPYYNTWINKGNVNPFAITQNEEYLFY